MPNSDGHNVTSLLCVPDLSPRLMNLASADAIAANPAFTPSAGLVALTADTPAGSMGTPGETVAQADSDTLYSVSCSPKAGTVINSYKWYLNSVLQEAGDNTYTLNVPPGKYVLTCVVSGTTGSRVITASVKSVVLVQ